MGIIVGVDASRNRSGGTLAHLKGVLGAGDPSRFGIERVHIWSHQSLLARLPDAEWLVKHSPPALGHNLLAEAWWQYRLMPDAVRRAGCKVLLCPDAGTIGRFRPSVVMSRDMLSFEPGEMQRYGLSWARLRLLLLKAIQARSLRAATGALFLTNYAARVIQTFTGPLDNVRVIPHGISGDFRVARSAERLAGTPAPVRCLYVSNADLYKHQWHVVTAVAKLRRSGHPVTLRLVGGGVGPARILLERAIEREDARGFVEVVEAVPHEKIPAELAEADLFVFASSCENMPNTLVEAMAAELPIACSRRGPMPEILLEAGTYFDPEDASSIAAAIERLLVDAPLRARMARHAAELSRQYSWQRCAAETWSYLADVATGLRTAAP